MSTLFLRDESGFLISSEFVIIATLMVCCVIVGFVSIRDSLVLELHDVSEAIGAVSQSYNIPGIQKRRSDGGFHARCSGFGFNDDHDSCDCSGISFPTVGGKSDPSDLDTPEGT